MFWSMTAHSVGNDKQYISFDMDVIDKDLPFKASFKLGNTTLSIFMSEAEFKGMIDKGNQELLDYKAVNLG